MSTNYDIQRGFIVRGLKAYNTKIKVSKVLWKFKEITKEEVQFNKIKGL